MPPDDTELSPVQRKSLEERLVDRRAALRAEVKSQFANADDPQAVGLKNWIENNEDWGAGDVLAQLDIAMVSRDLTELTEVEAALARMREGPYGTCEDCGATIPYARLQANPAALRCIACQDALERRVARQK